MWYLILAFYLGQGSPIPSPAHDPAFYPTTYSTNDAANGDDQPHGDQGTVRPPRPKKD